jgi:ribosomal protein S18
MCAKLTKLDLEDLRELAIIEGIAFVHMKSKRELCKELYEKLDTMRLDLSIYSAQCQNDFSVLTSDDVPKNLQDFDKPNFIKSQYLFTYKHNGLTYCDDIRALYKYINESGKIYNRQTGQYEHMHPDTRSPLSKSTVRAINRTYLELQRKIITLDDTEEQVEQLTPKQILSSFASSFSSKLMTGVKNIQLFIDCDQNKFKEFLTTLKSENIVTQNEFNNINGDLVKQKTDLVRILILKIDNDIVVSNGIPFSGMSAIITEIYNETF